jgi:hypothetical protein
MDIFCKYMQRFAKTTCHTCMKKIIITLLVITTLFAACKKESSTNPPDCRTATIENRGDPAADGLGWVLITDPVTRTFESADNLADTYKVNGLQVNVCYVKTDKDLICYCAQPFKKKVHITSISK